MAGKRCGCSTETCGCCEGTRKLTPLSTVNRPGLDALAYRVGTHGTFLETMKARLATITVDAPGADRQTIETFQPLRGLTTRNANDPAIALLDGWATVGDVLTFYQERIANEGYLPTATERRSIVELARLVGYATRPGVAATVFLAYALEDKQTDPVEIPIGARSQSIPGPGESAQAFETSEKIVARAEWNNLQVRLQRPQNITLDNVMRVESLYVAGTNTNLKTGERLLFVFGWGETDRMVLRTVLSTEGQFDKNRTEIKLQPIQTTMAVLFFPVIEFREQVKSLVNQQAAGQPKNPALQSLLDWVDFIVDTIAFGAPPTSTTNTGFEFSSDPEVKELMKGFAAKAQATMERYTAEAQAKAIAQANERDTTDPSKFIGKLLKSRIPQAASSSELDRKLEHAFAKGADAQAQMLVNFAPELKDSLYIAWASANVNSTAPSLKSVHAFRATAPLFGANVAKQPTYFQEDKNEGDKHFRGELKPQSDWLEWKVEGDESDETMFLDQPHEAILPGSYVMIETVPKPSDRTPTVQVMRKVKKIDDARTAQRTAYGLSSPTTKLTFEKGWWEIRKQQDISDTLRRTLIYGQSEEFTVVEEPILDPVGGAARGGEIELDSLYHELTSGRWIILSGERADIPGVTGVKASELLMISSLRQDFDSALPKDKTHTTLLLATPMAYAYKRDTLTIYGNVVKATHGETRKETLGNGDGSQALQTFELKQSPLTFVPAPTPAGVESTLKIYVNGVEWHEVDALAGSKPKDRVFVTKTDDQDKTSVIFGNGKEGSRLPSGVLNVESTYRNGIGKGGNVLPEQISLLQTRPLGVKSVLNPLRASGGANRETRDQARENAPLAVMALDRLVSLRDYADFTRTFAGIAKATERRLSDRRREFIHLTIAGVDDIPIDPISDLYRNLLAAFRKLGDGSIAVQVEPRELIMLVLSANVRLQPDYQWEPVATEIRAVLLDRFGFYKRALGQAALLCEVIASVQQVEGVAYVDVDVFGGVPEKTTDPNGTRRLLTPDEISELIQNLAKPPPQNKSVPVGPGQVVIADLAGFDDGVLHPAQLAILTPAVPEAIVLNRIK